MSTELEPDLQLEIAHVLFVDIVGDSTLLINEQHESLRELNQIFRNTDAFRVAEAAEKLICLPTGDGMALAFTSSPDAPVRCAVQASKALLRHPELKIRMGVHSGPVSGITDLNERGNVAGAGINTAQRVMDCSDAGHILLSKRVAEDLHQFSHWRPHLYELGECDVKHGEKISVVNLFTAELGNSERPKSFTKSAEKVEAAPFSTARPPSRKRGLIILACAAIAVLAVASFLLWHRQKTQMPASALGVPEKSIAVLPFENLSDE